MSDFLVPPSRADLFAWLERTDPGTPGDGYDLALAVAVLGQSEDCVVEPYDEGLHAACLRRAARVCAAKGLALGRLDAGDFGTVWLPQFDAEIERYEKGKRLGAFA